MKKRLVILIIALAVLIAALAVTKLLELYPSANKIPAEQIGLTIEQIPVADQEVVAENLAIPWEIAFLPNGEILVTERPGRLIKIGNDRTLIPIEGVEHVGEGGLMGLALHPNFISNNLLYLFLTAQSDTGLINRVERYRLENNQLKNKKTIIDEIPGARFHDGGRMAFGPDNKLYLTTGDAGKAEAAQDLNYLGGKILRLNDDGSIPEDNPFGTAVYSSGHRNPQGLAWDDLGRLWSTEHGRSVPLSGYDELNLIEAGKNYGWPVIQGLAEKDKMVTPVQQSGAKFTWAPTGAAYLNGSIFFAGLRGESLYQYDLDTTEFKAHLMGDFGRLRAVVTGPDGFIYLSTSNTDGRGEARTGDDKIIKISPAVFN